MNFEKIRIQIDLIEKLNISSKYQFKISVLIIIVYMKKQNNSIKTLADNHFQFQLQFLLSIEYSVTMYRQELPTLKINHASTINVKIRWLNFL